MHETRKKYLTVALISAVVVVLDQVTKYVVCASLPLHSRVEIIDGFLNLVHVRNTGIAFGLLKQLGNQYRLLALAAVCGVAFFLLVFTITQIKKCNRMQTAGLALILGGAVGNLVDRIRFGSVIDFIDAHWLSAYHWPAFNIADSAITVGIFVVVTAELLNYKRHAKQP